MRSKALLLVAVIVAAGVCIRARPAAWGQQPPPVTFKVEVNYVEIDAAVVDGQGKFVGDLTKNDFQVFEEGTPQTITAFSRVDVPITRPDLPLFKRAAIEPDVVSNLEPFNGRVFLLVLDDLQTDFTRTARARAAAIQFIRRYVGANDMVAVVTTGGRTSAAQEFTSSQSRLIAAVNRFMGQKVPGRDINDQELSFTARNTYAALQGFAEHMGGFRGRRKAIVWIGEGVDYNIDNPFTSPSADVVRSEMQEAIAAATRSNVAFYGIDPRGLGAGLDEGLMGAAPIAEEGTSMTASLDQVRRAHNSLRTVSEETGGFAVVNRNDINTAFERIIQDNSSYYVIGYYASNQKRDGKFRRLQIKVTRPGLTVRARKGYTAPKGRTSAAAAGAADAQEMTPEIRDALGSPIPSSGLGLTMFAAPFIGAAPKASLAFVIELAPGALTFKEKDGVFSEDVEIHVVAMDEKGKMQGGGRDSAPLRLTKRNYDSVTARGLRFTRRFDVPPGRYQIRVAVREANGGALGSLAHDVDVPDFSKGLLTMSGIAISSAYASRVATANPDPGFKDVLPSPPTAVRDFPRGDELALFVEVYDNQGKTPHRVAIKTTIAADDGRLAFSASDERRSEELQGARGGYGYVLKVPLAGFAPGRYVLRVEAQTLLSGGGTAAREIEFRVR